VCCNSQTWNNVIINKLKILFFLCRRFLSSISDKTLPYLTVYMSSTAGVYVGEVDYWNVEVIAFDVEFCFNLPSLSTSR
jgi:Na+/H+ antiporter NhaB